MVSRLQVTGYLLKLQPTRQGTPKANNHLTLAKRPRDRVQPSTFNRLTLAFGHAIAFNLQPSNLHPSTV
ncbi:hypothetical protein [Moorena bouillonii]|uniref:hypothetical protein n=1 Tax=Moorena bouillonii TaxID=207920 RepID=UPI001181178A|nr:hypothetical protein [Moorena bouillonii]